MNLDPEREIAVELAWAQAAAGLPAPVLVVAPHGLELEPRPECRLEPEELAGASAGMRPAVLRHGPFRAAVILLPDLDLPRPRREALLDALHGVLLPDAALLFLTLSDAGPEGDPALDAVRGHFTDLAVSTDDYLCPGAPPWHALRRRGRPEKAGAREGADAGAAGETLDDRDAALRVRHIRGVRCDARLPKTLLVCPPLAVDAASDAFATFPVELLALAGARKQAGHVVTLIDALDGLPAALRETALTVDAAEALLPGGDASPRGAGPAGGAAGLARLHLGRSFESLERAIDGVHGVSEVVVAGPRVGSPEPALRVAALCRRLHPRATVTLWFGGALSPAEVEPLGDVRVLPGPEPSDAWAPGDLGPCRRPPETLPFDLTLPPAFGPGQRSEPLAPALPSYRERGAVARELTRLRTTFGVRRFLLRGRALLAKPGYLAGVLDRLATGPVELPVETIAPLPAERITEPLARKLALAGRGGGVLLHFDARDDQGAAQRFGRPADEKAIARAVRALKRVGLQPALTVLLGYPGQRRRAALEAVAFAWREGAAAHVERFVPPSAAGAALPGAEGAAVDDDAASAPLPADVLTPAAERAVRRLAHRTCRTPAQVLGFEHARPASLATAIADGTAAEGDVAAELAAELRRVVFLQEWPSAAPWLALYDAAVPAGHEGFAGVWVGREFQWQGFAFEALPALVARLSGEGTEVGLQTPLAHTRQDEERVVATLESVLRLCGSRRLVAINDLGLAERLRREFGAAAVLVPGRLLHRAAAPDSLRRPQTPLEAATSLARLSEFGLETPTLCDGLSLSHLPPGLREAACHVLVPFAFTALRSAEPAEADRHAEPGPGTPPEGSASPARHRFLGDVQAQDWPASAVAVLQDTLPR